MAHAEEPLTPHRVVAERMKELRKRNGWTAQRLAEEMAKVGVQWDRSIVTNLELGRRATVSTEEMLALAYVLNVAPVHLLVPPDASDEARYRVVPDGRTTPPKIARAWIRGNQPIKPGPHGVIDGRRFFSEVPVEEHPAPRFSSPTEGDDDG